MNKARMITHVVDVVKSFAVPMEEIQDAINSYFDVMSGEELTDEDTAHTGLTAANIISFITTLQQLNNFFTNQAVTQGLYREHINKAKYSG